MSSAQADGYADEDDVAEWRGAEHPVEEGHPPYCRCDLCIAWYMGPEAYLYGRDGLPPE